MNSIDKNQSEENYKNVGGEETGIRIKDMAESAKSCFFARRQRPVILMEYGQ